MKNLSLSFLVRAILTVVHRFPMAFLAALVGSCCFLWLVDDGHSVLEKDLLRMAATCFLGLPLFVALTVFSEKNDFSVAQKWGLQAIGLAILAIFWLLFDLKKPFQEVHQLVYFVGLAFLFHLFVSFATYLDRSSTDEDFWEFNKQLFGNFLTGALYSFVILLGVWAAIFASHELFKLDFRLEKAFGRWFVLVAGIFQTLFFLANFPTDFKFDAAEIRFERSIRNLVKFILIPIVALYFLILYAYAGKIALTWRLPVGWVAWLVVGFSVAGVFTFCLNFLLPKIDDSRLLAAYRRWFWPVVLPILVLLFVAVGRRIHDYGLTEDRYLIAHLGTWLAVVGGVFIFYQRADLRLIPISLALFSIIYLLPVVGGMDAGIRSQTHILETLLIKNDLISDGKVKPNANPLQNEDTNRMRDILEYLTARNALGSVEKWLGKPISSVTQSTSRYDNSNAAASALGINSQGNFSEFEAHYFYSTHQFDDVSLSGFDTLFMLNLAKNELESHGLMLSENGDALIFSENGKVMRQVDLTTAFSSLWEKYSSTSGQLDNMAFPVEIEGETQKAKLLIMNMTLKKRTDKITADNLNGWLLIGKK